ncbi:MAG TPA: hypothetical protein VLS93_18970, partial [Anaeromyxobacteraceae bacterium]|nr:hypothetical protein [Anaeromyxobacteraceae bacterium]
MRTAGECKVRKLGPGIVGALVFLLACGEARKLEESATAGTCTRCHGGTDNPTGAPPRDVAGRVDPSLPSVGAHTAHVAGGGLAPAFDCNACHPKPATLTSPGHGDGVVSFAWSPLASANGTLSPAYDPVAGCSAVYC